MRYDKEMAGLFYSLLAARCSLLAARFARKRTSLESGLRSKADFARKLTSLVSMLLLLISCAEKTKAPTPLAGFEGGSIVFYNYLEKGLSGGKRIHEFSSSLLYFLEKEKLWVGRDVHLKQGQRAFEQSPQNNKFTIMKARRGEMDQFFRNLRLISNVYLLSTNKTELWTEELHWQRDKNEVWTEKHVRIRRPGGYIQEGEGLKADLTIEEVRIKKSTVILEDQK